ncbi:branched chain amino acid ABC transporter substrate-binding protein, partial [Thermus scotoductus]
TGGRVLYGVRKGRMEGLTGTIEVDDKGDNKKAKYFVMQVASTGNWADNKLIRVIEMAAPGAK